MCRDRTETGDMVVVVDIETENTGAEIMADNKRIISVQLGDSSNQELYYADALDSSQSLVQVKTRINSIVKDGGVLAGYNVKGFDIPILKQFLEVTIPDANVLEIGEMKEMVELAQKVGKKHLRLEEACTEFGISSNHKWLMNARAEKFKNDPAVLANADKAAQRFVIARGWSFNFSRGYAIDKIAGGRAILESYQEFVSKRGSKDTLFYEYAVGDVVCEYRLMEALTC